MSYKAFCTNILRENQAFMKCLGIAKRCYTSRVTANMSKQNDEETTHFGFQTIRESEKIKEGKNFVAFAIVVLFSFLFLFRQCTFP
jgi:hypothetical protein